MKSARPVRGMPPRDIKEAGRTSYGVVGFSLYIDDVGYGHYPCDEGRFEESMTAAVADAIEYGKDGVLFKTDWKSK